MTESAPLLPVIHIGLNKTGSTSLQRMLFSKHEDVYFLGKYPTGKRSPAEGRYINHGVGDFLTDLIEFEPEERWNHFRRTGDAFEPGQPAEWKQAFSDHIQPYIQNGQVPIWSLEKLCMGTPIRRELRARRIVKAFGQCKILVVLREPLALIESLYFQRLKASQLSRLPDKSTGRHYKIEAWLEEHFTGLQQEIMGVIDYGRTIQWFTELLGPERIRVLLFEELVQQPNQFLNQLSQFCGINSIRSNALMKGERRNTRWTNQSISRLKWIGRIPLGPTLFRRLPRHRRAQYLGVHNHNPLKGEKARARLPSDWIDRISDACRGSNRQLRDQWNLPLEEYGYPL